MQHKKGTRRLSQSPLPPKGDVQIRGDDPRSCILICEVVNNHVLLFNGSGNRRIGGTNIAHHTNDFFNSFRCLRGFFLNRKHLSLNFLRRFSRLTLTRISRTSGFNRCVQRQQVGLTGDALNQAHNTVNFNG